MDRYKSTYSCKYPKCHSKYYSSSDRPGYQNKRFFRFPRDKTVYNIWVKNCNLDPNINYKNSYVCQDHFLPNHLNYYGTRVVRGSAPVKFDSNPEALEKSNTSELFESDVISQNGDSLPAEEDILNVMIGLMSEIQPHNLLRSIRRLCQNGKFKEIEEKLGHLPKDFRKQKLSELREYPFSKEWTVEDNILALWIYKRIPHMYKYLEVKYGLPKSLLLKELLWKIPFQPGVHDTIMKQVKINIENLRDDCRCSLIFDEMKLNQGLSYERNQIISGYENLGYLGSTNREANNVLVFMIRGIKKQWKQVVAYYFSSGPIQSDILQNLLTNVIEIVQKVGFTILTLICDLKETYSVAFQRMCGEQKYVFTVNNSSIGIVFNGPYLLRATRNALLSCDVQFDEGKFAKFNYIRKAFDLDKKNKIFSEVQKLKPNDFNFMNNDIKSDISIAIYQLSHSVASCIETWVSLKELPVDAVYTAEFVDCIDNIFDSLTGSKYNSDVGKKYRCALSTGSLHLLLWLDFLRIIDSWKFFDINTNKDVSNDYSLLVFGWKKTIHSIMYVWDILKENAENIISLKSFNMDPMNILFENIRNYYQFPNCHQFVVALNIDLLKNTRAVKKNFEQLECVPLINATDLLKNCEVRTTHYHFKKVPFDFTKLDEFEISAYVAGYILKHIQIPDNCEICNNNIFSDVSRGMLIEESDFNIMLYANDQVVTFVNKIRQLMFEFLELNAHTVSLKDIFKKTYENQLQVRFCNIHNCEKGIMDFCMDIFIFKWVEYKQKKYV